MYLLCTFGFFFFKQKTAYEMRISDWSSDVCSSDLYGVTFDLVERDDKGEPETGARLIQELLNQEQVDVVFGPSLSGVALQVAQIGRASCRERVCQYV